MVYEKQTWNTGETITADKLNHIEKGIVNSENGYECTEEETVVFEGALTTSSSGGSFCYVNFTPIESFNSENIIVNLDGTDYILPKVSISTGGVDADIYGEANESGPLFATYPCAIAITYGTYQFFVPQEGTYEVKISIAAIKTNVSECFSKAVEKVAGKPLKYVVDDPGNHGGVIENAIKGMTVDGTYVQIGNYATGKFSHAEGSGTTASGNNSHAQNNNTIAQGQSQTVIGEYNIAQGNNESKTNTDYVLIIGNGTSASNRSNAFAMKWDGTFVFANGTEITPAQFASLLALLN